MDVQTIYQRRFADSLAFRRRMWDVLSSVSRAS
jgi:hypothetical protein